MKPALLPAHRPNAPNALGKGAEPQISGTLRACRQTKVV